VRRIVFGCRVGDWGRFDRNVRPHTPPSAEMCALGGQTSIAKAYNALLGYCRSHPVGVDALVLLRDNLELIDVDATAQDPTTSPAASSGCHLRRARRLPRAPARWHAWRGGEACRRGRAPSGRLRSPHYAARGAGPHHHRLDAAGGGAMTDSIGKRMRPAPQPCARKWRRMTLRNRVRWRHVRMCLAPRIACGRRDEQRRDRATHRLVTSRTDRLVPPTPGSAARPHTPHTRRKAGYTG
jgi:hypothetical protein